MSEKEHEFNEDVNEIIDQEEDYFDVRKQDKKEKKVNWKSFDNKRKEYNRENPY